MANGKQVADQNYQAFLAWSSSLSDDDFKQIIFRGKLNRVELAKAVGCGKSAFSQNPALKDALLKLEEELREKKILPPLEDNGEDGGPQKYDSSSRKSVLLLKQRGELERENIEQKAKIKELERKLERFGELNKTLAEMGFMQR